MGGGGETGGSGGGGGSGGVAGSFDAGKDSSHDAKSDTGKTDAGADSSKDAATDTHEAGVACGNGVIEGTEACDNGTANDTCQSAADGAVNCNKCSPICTDNTACYGCMTEQCPEFLDVCSGVDGVAAAGPGKGQDRVTLCHQVYKCVMQSGCGIYPVSTPTLGCFCGDKDPDACVQAGMANGPCRAEILAAMETSEPAEVVNRYTDITWAGGAALQKVLCEVSACLDTCYYGRVVPAPRDGGSSDAAPDGQRD